MANSVHKLQSQLPGNQRIGGDTAKRVDVVVVAELVPRDSATSHGNSKSNRMPGLLDRS